MTPVFLNALIVTQPRDGKMFRLTGARSVAYAPAMTLALLSGVVSVTTVGSSFVSGIVLAGIFFGIGFLPAVAFFHFARLALRTRFSRG